MARYVDRRRLHCRPTERNGVDALVAVVTAATDDVDQRRCRSTVRLPRAILDVGTRRPSRAPMRSLPRATSMTSPSCNQVDATRAHHCTEETRLLPPAQEQLAVVQRKPGERARTRVRQHDRMPRAADTHGKIRSRQRAPRPGDHAGPVRWDSNRSRSGQRSCRRCAPGAGSIPCARRDSPGVCPLRYSGPASARGSRVLEEPKLTNPVDLHLVTLSERQRHLDWRLGLPQLLGQPACWVCRRVPGVDTRAARSSTLRRCRPEGL